MRIKPLVGLAATIAIGLVFGLFMVHQAKAWRIGPPVRLPEFQGLFFGEQVPICAVIARPRPRVVSLRWSQRRRGSKLQRTSSMCVVYTAPGYAGNELITVLVRFSDGSRSIGRTPFPVTQPPSNP